MENLDFEISSHEWRKNKIYLGKGYFKYKCNKPDCNNILYCYTVQHKMFNLFASEIDLKNKSNPKQFNYCEDHLKH